MAKAGNRSSAITKLFPFGFYPSAIKRWIWLIIFSVLSLSMKDNLEFVHTLLHQIPNSLHHHVAGEGHDLMDHADQEHDDDDPFHKTEKDPFKSVFKAHWMAEELPIVPFAFSSSISFMRMQVTLPSSRCLPALFSPPDYLA